MTEWSYRERTQDLVANDPVIVITVAAAQAGKEGDRLHRSDR
jgi:hypothetical protein